MSSISGIIDTTKRTTDFKTLHSMGRATVQRGGEESGAYINGGTGIFCNYRESRVREPHTVTVNGKNYTVAIDGYIKNAPHSSAETALEYYLSFGAECFSKIEGDFALVIHDEYRGETLLARSMGGSHPLFCSYERGKLIFSSEIKGMLRAMSGAVRIDGEKLLAHLFEPAGTFCAGDIYMDIDELSEGKCLVFSPIGIRILPCLSARAENKRQNELIVPDEPDPSYIRSYLAEALIAFDYPQFDAFMPEIMDTLRYERKKEKRTAYIVDGAFGYSEKYLIERADRIGGSFGVSFVSSSPDKEGARGKRYKNLEAALEGVLNTCDIRILEGIYGEGIISRVHREKSLEIRIRMMGMLCQTAFLAKIYPILICENGVARDIYTSRLSTI